MKRIGIVMAFLLLAAFVPAMAGDGKVYRNEVCTVTIPSDMSMDTGTEDGYREIYLYFTGDRNLSKGTITLSWKRAEGKTTLSEGWKPIRQDVVARKHVVEEKSVMFAGAKWNYIVYSGPIGCCMVKEAVYYAVPNENIEVKMHYDCTGNACALVERNFDMVKGSMKFQ